MVVNCKRACPGRQTTGIPLCYSSPEDAEERSSKTASHRVPCAEHDLDSVRDRREEIPGWGQPMVPGCSSREGTAEARRLLAPGLGGRNSQVEAIARHWLGAV